MMNHGDALLEVKNLKKYFPIRRGLFRRTAGYVRAVDGVSLRIGRGRTLGLVGETGSGKTTLGRAVLRLIPVDSGRIIFDGEDILGLSGRRMRELRCRMQIVFQDPYGSLNPRMRVGEIVSEGMRNFGLGNRKEIRERTAELLETVGLSPSAAGLYPHEFSGGQRQRIGIARALALNPDFIVCDEPVSSLDVSVQAQILNLLDDLQDRFDLAYLFIAHDLSVVEHISDTVAVIYRGRIMEEAPRRELYANPLHPYTRSLLESIPVPDPAVPPPHPPREHTGEDGKRTVVAACRFFSRCPRRREICLNERPELREIDPEHRVACHFPEA